MRIGGLAAGAALAGSVALGAASAPPPRKTTLQEQPFPGRGEHTLLVRTVVPAGGEVAPHTHPGLEMCYLESGRASVRLAGRPDVVMGAGDSYAAPPGVVHAVRNTGGGELVLVSTYVVDAAKPLSSPAG